MDERSSKKEAHILGMPGGGAPGATRQHTLNMVNRESLTMQGVQSVESFDDEEIIMETDMGTLTLKGEELHIKQLDLDTGRFAVEGFITACIYSTPRNRGGRPTKGRSFLERLLR